MQSAELLIGARPGRGGELRRLSCAIKGEPRAMRQGLQRRYAGGAWTRVPIKRSSAVCSGPCPLRRNSPKSIWAT